MFRLPHQKRDAPTALGRYSATMGELMLRRQTELAMVAAKAEFYSLSGKLLKTATFDYNNAIEFEGKKTPFISRMTIRDALIDAETTMEFGTVKVAKVPAAKP